MSNSNSIENRLLRIQREFQGTPSDIEEIKAVKKRLVLIMGAGNGLGAALAREFASHQFITIVCRRNKDKLEPLISEIQKKGQICHGYGIDCRKEDQVIKLVSDVERFYGAIDVAIFNVGVNIKYNISETTSRQFQKIWEMNTFAGFLFGREVALRMQKREKGTIIFTGATASIRGNIGFSAFGASKAGLRSLAQTMAKELSPQNIHVAHVIIDGGIDSEFIREMLKDKIQQNKEKNKNNNSVNNSPQTQDMLLNPTDIAKNYYNIYKQPKNSWTFEMDLRPYTEQW